MSANLTPTKGEGQELRKCAQVGDIASIEALLKIGANINDENNYGQRPLHTAASSGQTDVISFLLRNGAQIHAKTKAGDTACIIAARNGHPQVVDLLLKEGAQPNAMNADGWTALHFAIDKCHEAVAHTLLAVGADPTSRTKDGKTPMDLMKDSAPLSLKNLLHEATVQQELRSPLKRTIGTPTPSMSRISSPPRVMSPEMARSASRTNRTLLNEFNAVAVEELPTVYQPIYAPMPMRQEMVVDSSVRNGITEKLIELVERQAAEIEVLRQEVARLNLRVTELARVGFPYTLELKLDGRLASYHLGPSPNATAPPANSLGAGTGLLPSSLASTASSSSSNYVPAVHSPLASSVPLTASAMGQQHTSSLPLHHSLAGASSPSSSPQKPTAPVRRINFDDIPIRPTKDAMAASSTAEEKS